MSEQSLREERPAPVRNCKVRRRGGGQGGRQDDRVSLPATMDRLQTDDARRGEGLLAFQTCRPPGPEASTIHDGNTS